MRTSAFIGTRKENAKSEQRDFLMPGMVAELGVGSLPTWNQMAWTCFGRLGFLNGFQSMPSPVPCGSRNQRDKYVAHRPLDTFQRGERRLQQHQRTPPMAPPMPKGPLRRTSAKRHQSVSWLSVRSQISSIPGRRTTCFFSSASLVSMRSFWVQLFNLSLPGGCKDQRSCGEVPIAVAAHP